MRLQWRGKRILLPPPDGKLNGDVRRRLVPTRSPIMTDEEPEARLHRLLSPVLRRDPQEECQRSS